MTRKDLTWKLPTLPTDMGLAKLVEQNVLTAQEARDILLNKGKKTSEASKTTVVHLLLDSSGSMESVRNATIDGYNEYINSLKEDGGKFKVSLTLFDSDMQGELRLEKRHKTVNIDDVPPLTRETYKPSGGTPLYDAFCTVAKDCDDRLDEKNLFVILTDGEENMSKEYTEKHMTTIKKNLEDVGNWSFIYLGANQDAWANASRFGYSTSNVTNFNATQKGTNMAFVTLASATRSFSASPSMSTSVFYTDTQKKDNEQTK